MSLIDDLRHALGILARAPGFAAAVIATFALGIGINSAIFSVVDAVVFRALPYPAPERLVRLYTQFPAQKFDRSGLSLPEFRELQRDATAYVSMFAWTGDSANLAGGESPIRVTSAVTSSRIFDTLGATALGGRTYGDDDGGPGAARVAVISHGLWQRSFGGETSVIGRSIDVDGLPTVVVGVMPASFAFPSPRTDIWVPLTHERLTAEGRGNHSYQVIGRLGDGVGLDGARHDLDAVMAQSVATVTRHPLDPRQHPLGVEPLHDVVVRDTRQPMLLLLGAVFAVLVIACTNVVTLFLARSEARQRDLAVRSALGASRGRLVRLLLCESLVVALAGGVLGLALARAGLSFILSLQDGAVPRAHEIGLDGRTLLFTASVSLMAGAIFGLAPLARIRAAALAETLKRGGRREAGERQTSRRVLVAAQMALAVVLVFAAGLLMRSFWRLLAVNPGFRVERLVTATLSFPRPLFQKPDAVVSTALALQDRLRGVPGVERVSIASGRPPGQRMDANDIAIEGRPTTHGEAHEGPQLNVDYWQVVGDDYFATMGIGLVSGRLFAPSDDAGTAPVAIVNEAFAAKFFPEENPLGRRVQATPWLDNAAWLTIVGVVRDVKQRGLDAPAGTDLYMPLRQIIVATRGAPRSLTVVVSTVGDDAALLLPSIRAAVAAVVPMLPLSDSGTMSWHFDRSLARPRFLMVLFNAFGAAALLLAAVGVYGVVAVGVARRTREIGLRMALGASRRDVLGQVLGRGLTVATAGVIAGAALALVVARVMRSAVFGIVPMDPLTLTFVAVVLMGVATAASFIPAWRASRVDPLVALRED